MPFEAALEIRDLAGAKIGRMQRPFLAAKLRLAALEAAHQPVRRARREDRERPDELELVAPAQAGRRLLLRVMLHQAPADDKNNE